MLQQSLRSEHSSANGENYINRLTGKKEDFGCAVLYLYVSSTDSISMMCKKRKPWNFEMLLR